MESRSRYSTQIAEHVQTSLAVIMDDAAQESLTDTEESTRKVVGLRSHDRVMRRKQLALNSMKMKQTLRVRPWEDRPQEEDVRGLEKTAVTEEINNILLKHLIVQGSRFVCE